MVCSTRGHSSQQRQVGAANMRPLLHTCIHCAHVPRHANGVAPVLVKVHRSHRSATHHTTQPRLHMHCETVHRPDTAHMTPGKRPCLLLGWCSCRRRSRCRRRCCRRLGALVGIQHGIQIGGGLLWLVGLAAGTATCTAATTATTAASAATAAGGAPTTGAAVAGAAALAGAVAGLATVVAGAGEGAAAAAVVAARGAAVCLSVAGLAAVVAHRAVGTRLAAVGGAVAGLATVVAGAFEVGAATAAARDGGAWGVSVAGDNEPAAITSG